MAILGYLSCLVLIYQVLSSFLSFQRNLRAAKQTGLPYILRPVFELNYFYFLLQPVFHYVIENLPGPIQKRLDPTNYLSIYRKAWRFYVKHEKHQQLGDVFFIVSPGMLLLEVADADLCVQITGRRLDFVKPAWAYSLPRTFGRNIVEAEEEIWKRHRRVVAPQYSDTIHSFVWDQATKLGREMFSEWHGIESPNIVYKAPETSRESRDLNSLAIRVIMAAAFGISIPFRTDPANTEQSTEIDGVVDFADSMRVVIGNAIPVMLFPRFFLRWSFPSFRQLAKSLDHVYSYLSYVMHRGLEKSTTKEDGKRGFSTDSILNGLTKALAQGVVPGENELSQSEVIGNIFMLSVAGSGTTADTMHFAIIMLALHENVQNWVLEELDEVMKEFGDDWKYQQAFPRLVRISSIMMETLRLFPPVISIPKWTEKNQSLNYNSSSFTLPPKTLIALSGPGLHYNPKWWGKNAAEFHPQRWLSEGSKALCQEQVNGSFISFSRGARGCLGKRFAEAEFVAIMSVILKEHRVELVVEEGETLKIAQKKARFALEQSVTHLSLHVGGKVSLRFVRRK